MKDKIKGVLNTTTNKIIGGGLAVVVVCGIIFGIYALTNNNSITLQLKKDKTEIIVEYGQTVSLDPKEYLDFSKLDNDDKTNILKEVKLESNLKNEDSKEYPAVGKYEITITYSNQKLVSKVEVKDTTTPVFNETNEVTFEEGTEFDYATSITATDLQEVTIEFDASAVNKDVSGEYTVKAVAKDKSDNEVIKDIKVVVTAKQVVEEKPNTSNSGSGATAGSATKPSSSGGNSSKPSTGGSSSSSGTGSNTSGTTPPPVQQPEAPHVHTFSPYANRWFNSGNEADTWAKEYEGPDGTWAGKTWGGNKCSCGKWGITSFQNITYWQ